MDTSRYDIVVGVDGSDSARRAADWATAEAQRRTGASLTLVLINDDPARESYVREAVADIAGRCGEARPSLEVSHEVAEGHPIEELVRRSSTADLLVLGSRGYGPVADALLGSVSVGVARRTRCPIVVVRGDESEHRDEVVVGVDDSARSEAALEFGFTSARNRDSELLVMRAMSRSSRTRQPTSRRESPSERVEHDLAKRLERWGAWFPEVTARRIDVDKHPVTALLELSKGAGLVVVGRRGGGGFSGLMLGSVARGVLHRASCPVAMVPEAGEQE
ncbi:Nucleotide-binding universal stress protein, UspA family [Actinopolyspora lacussalsi subsp. righensis]|uniref:Nucleotide-binding universal stress protein, UspA family n=1 Tax=Actinopolyspora righensis TaxID=995060 RepID=A0A1I6X8A6_9ACTN|nr:universal stress protein [Actinopolyspora righensis]SFT34507.1 Nucleotide-binding universal stress protein, UspA family [Actinopolyspora righensis]